MKSFHVYQGGGPSPRALSALLDQFAEYLSHDMPLDDIADAMDVTRGSACVFLHMLTDKFGARAQ